jgi:hypothetical protein
MRLGIIAYDIPEVEYPECTFHHIVDGGIEPINTAVSNLMNADCDGILFLGKGCTPQADTIRTHKEILGRHAFPLITCGRILDKDAGWKDYRQVGAAAKLKLFNSTGTTIQNSAILTAGYGISLGHVGMNRAAVDRLTRMTEMYFNSPTLFPKINNPTSFGLGKMLSLSAWCARVMIHMLPTGQNAVVYNGKSPNPYAKLETDDSSEQAVSDLGSRMKTDPPGLDFFDSASDFF